METKRIITSENWMFDFGKYRGKTVSSVIDCNPGYIQWLTENDVLQFLIDGVWYWEAWQKRVDKYNRAIVYKVKGGEQPDVSWHGVESRDLVLSPEEAVRALRQHGFPEAYVEITNTSANAVRQAWQNFTPTLDEDEDEDQSTGDYADEQ